MARLSFPTSRRARRGRGGEERGGDDVGLHAWGSSHAQDSQISRTSRHPLSHWHRSGVRPPFKCTSDLTLDRIAAQTLSCNDGTPSPDIRSSSLTLARKYFCRFLLRLMSFHWAKEWLERIRLPAAESFTRVSNSPPT
jgi:hypothetical protein